MELRQLRNFLTIAETGSFTRAALQIGTAQPALSRDIRLLEQELGTKLFDRNGRGVSLTREGAIFLAETADHVAALDSAAMSMAARLANAVGTIRLGWTSAFGNPLSGRMISACTRRFPGITVSVLPGSSASVRDWVASDRLDIGVYNSERPSSGYTVRNLMQTPLYFVARKEICRGLPSETISFADVASYPLIVYSCQNALGRIVQGHAQEHKINLNIYAMIDDFYAVYPMIRDGHATTIAPKSLLLGNPDDDNLICRRVVEPSLPFYTLMAISKAKRSNPVVNCLADIISEETHAALEEGLTEGTPFAPTAPLAPV